jgi:biotin carboxylase
MKALILGGGLDQVDLVNKLNQRDILTIVVDYNESPVAAQYADKHYQESTLDYEVVVKLAKDEQVDLIATVCTDQALLIAAQASEELGLFFPIGAEQARNLTNKKWMKRVLTENSIPTAQYKTFEGELYDIEGFDYPVVAKPVDSNSSKGVKRANNEAELKAVFQEAKKESRSGNVIVEEFIEGREISIDGIVDGTGQAQLLMISESIKSPVVSDGFSIVGSIYSADVHRQYATKVSEVLNDIAQAFELRNCPMLVQALVSEKGISIIELSARTGGGLKHKLLKKASGVDVIDLTIDSFLKQDIQNSPVAMSDEKIVIKYMYSTPCLLEASHFGSKVEGYLTKNTGDEVKGFHNSSHRIGSFFVEGSDNKDIYNEILKTYEDFTISGNPQPKLIHDYDNFFEQSLSEQNNVRN